MINRILQACIVTVLCASSLAAGEKLTKENYPLKDLRECSSRGGLPNFYRKLKEGKEVTIVYFGGSVISQEGYRILSQKWFQDKFPKAKITGIHAGLGGTGTDLGVFRMDKDVLPHKPDLVMMDWAGNDMHARDIATLKCSTEGVIRKIWKNFPECDIVFMHTVSVKDKPLFAKGKMKFSISVHEDVADYYQIPTIYMGMDVIKLYNAGKLIFKDSNRDMVQVAGDELNVDSAMMVNKDGKVPFSRDGSHPYQNTGHRLFMDAIERSMNRIEKIGTPGAHALPKPIMADNWENAKMLPITSTMMSGDWARVTQAAHPFYRDSFKTRMPEMWQGKPGAKLHFSFRGTMVGFYDIRSPSSGCFDIRVDQKSKIICNFDSYTTGYSRLSRSIGGVFQDGTHRVEVEVLSKKVEKRKILERRKQGALVDKNPKAYEPINWYVGAILMLGSETESEE